MTDRKSKELSKTMSWVLRHGIIKLGLTMDSDGYILLDDLIKLPQIRKYTVEDVEFIVRSNDKQRFNLITDDTTGIRYIRANQGHCKEVGMLINDDSHLNKLDVPMEMCLHGTNYNAYKIIKERGLSAMGRKHIHFAAGFPEDDGVKSGLRNFSKVIIHVDMKKAMDRGKTFYISDNGVILTSDIIEPDLFHKVQML